MAAVTVRSGAVYTGQLFGTDRGPSAAKKSLNGLCLRSAVETTAAGGKKGSTDVISLFHIPAADVVQLSAQSVPLGCDVDIVEKSSELTASTAKPCKRPPRKLLFGFASVPSA
jgi:hypothetical protein